MRSVNHEMQFRRSFTFQLGVDAEVGKCFAGSIFAPTVWRPRGKGFARCERGKMPSFCAPVLREESLLVSCCKPGEILRFAQNDNKKILPQAVQPLKM
jgi:hypothetical protein